MNKTIGVLLVLCMIAVTVGSAWAAAVGSATIDNSLLSAVEISSLSAKAPTTFEEADKNIVCIQPAASSSIRPCPVPQRFLMWTNDGEHIMWGRSRNGYFTAVDNNMKKAWGIYQNGMFAGFYDGQLFYGKYSNGSWKAVGLFGLKAAAGRYVLFPSMLTAVPLQAISN